MISTPYDSIAERFNADRTRLYPKEREYLALLLDPLTGPGTILDLGCGTGNPIAMHIAFRGHRLVGVDGSEAMLAIARKQLPGHRWIHELMERVEFDETFAAVVCWDSLFHLPRQQYQPVISKIHRWLAPGGRLMVSSGFLVDENEGGFTDTMFGHEFFYDSLPPKRMVAMMEETGFDILVAEVCDQPDGGRNKGKWATVAAKKA
ncbi:MAG: class I SAM-dependent methyltransferase [Methylacidiphilales bacterium]|nr:class I SAM-dependent methyltransferase [Candidatus Methylacidiphilales bacterium]